MKTGNDVARIVRVEIIPGFGVELSERGLVERRIFPFRNIEQRFVERREGAFDVFARPLLFGRRRLGAFLFEERLNTVGDGAAAKMRSKNLACPVDE